MIIKWLIPAYRDAIRHRRFFQGSLSKWLLTCLLFTGVNVYGQESDTLQIEVAVGAIGSTEGDFLPLYLVGNSWGAVQEDQDVFLEGDLKYQRKFSDRLSLSTGFSFRNDLLVSHYIQLRHDLMYLSLGRSPRIIGGTENSLSSGSLGMSNNAQPIPMIELVVSEYINVPFTKGYFKTKGHYGHGWLENDRHVTNAQLHSKSFYLMLDLNKEIGWSAASGVVHFAQFGGTSPNQGTQPSSFTDYLRVIRGAGIPNPNGTTAGESNAVGNHLGIIETTVTKKLGNHKIIINYQKPFEDEGSIQYVSLTDYLFGLEWELPEKGKFLKRVYIEYIQTKWQGGPGLPDPNEVEGILTETDNLGYPFGGRDDTYNNWIYQDGWTYNSMVIGNPLFLTHERTLNFLAPYPDYAVAVANNRLRAVHLGVEAETVSEWKMKGLFTYSSNFGTYSGLYNGRFQWDGVALDTDYEYVFRPAKSQFYSVMELEKEVIWKEKPWGMRIRLAFDTGDLYNAMGAELSLRYHLTAN